MRLADCALQEVIAPCGAIQRGGRWTECTPIGYAASWLYMYFEEGMDGQSRTAEELSRFVDGWWTVSECANALRALCSIGAFQVVGFEDGSPLYAPSADWLEKYSRDFGAMEAAVKEALPELPEHQESDAERELSFLNLDGNDALAQVRFPELPIVDWALEPCRKQSCDKPWLLRLSVGSSAGDVYYLVHDTRRIEIEGDELLDEMAQVRRWLCSIHPDA